MPRLIRRAKSDNGVKCQIKSELLQISLAIAAAQRGRRVYYGTLIDLITSLEEAQAAAHLARRLAVLTHPSLLVVDEIGYLPITHTGAVLFVSSGTQ